MTANTTVSRYLLSKPKTLTNFLSRSFSTASPSLTKSPSLTSSPSLLYRLRPLATIAIAQRLVGPAVRAFSSRAASSSLNDPNPNWSNRPPKETILLDGCDFEHWLVVVEKPDVEKLTRDEIIDGYIKTLAQVLGSEDEARMKIYSVSTRCYFAFGALVSEELSFKIKELPNVRWVLPDSYLDVRNKDYGGEPFIDGKAVPYDPKYHEEWIRNNARANDRNRRNDRPRNNDRSKNFDRRNQNNFQGRDMPQNNQQGGMPRGPPNNMGGVPPNNMGGGPPNNMGGGPPSNMGGGPPNNMGGPPPNNMGGRPPSNMGGMPQNMGGMPQSNNYGQRPAMPPPNQGWSSNPNFQNNPNQGASARYQNAPSNSPNQGGNMGYQGGPTPPNYQNNYPSHTPNQGGNAYQGGAPNYGNNYTPNRDGGNY